MKSDTRAGRRARVKAGYEAIELLDWAEPPDYDPGSRKLYCAKELRFGASEQAALNYNIRAPGRKVVNMFGKNKQSD